MGTKLRNLTLISFVIFGFLVSQFTIALILPKPRSLPPIPGFSNIPSGPPETLVSTPPVKLQETGNDGSDFGHIVGKVVNADTQEVIENAKITIPELNLSSKSDLNGKLQFTSIYVGKNKESFVTIKVSAPGFGEHTMVDVGVFPGITATVTLELKKGNKPTNWFGLLRPEEREQKKLPDLEASPLTVGATAYSSQTVPPAYIRVAIRTLCTGTEGNGCDVGKPNPTGAVIRTDVVDFDFYVKHVLPQEWIPSWPAESLKAGAMAVKEYGNPYVDKRDKSFYYFDKNLTASTGYYYTIAAYNSTSGWSDFTNYDGYVYAVTQPAY